MKKLESSLKNMVIVLTGVTVVAGALLGYVNEFTKEPIAQANAKALSDAIAIVVPGFDNNPAEAPEWTFSGTRPCELSWSVPSSFQSPGK